MQVDRNRTPYRSAPFDTPRDWQIDAADAALDAIEAGTRGIVSAVMGAGKSAVIAELCDAVQLDDGESIVVTTPKLDLVDQISATIREVVGARHVGTFDGRTKQPTRPIVVTCVPSAPTLADAMQEAGRDCTLWIADEAHGTECDTMHKSAVELQPDAQIGFTATPYRSDDDEELRLWERCLVEYTAEEAMQDGVVVPYDVEHWTGSTPGVETLDDVCVEMIRRHTDGLGPGVVNAPKSFKKHQRDGTYTDDADQFAARLRQEGIPARAVHSKKRDAHNKKALADLESGELRCIVHVDMFSEGSDFPFLRWMCLRRPVGSKVRFCQEVGRALRGNCPGKDKALFLDPHDLFGSFGLTYEAVLGGGEATPPDPVDEEEADEAKEAIDAHAPFPQTDVPAPVVEATTSFLRKVKLQIINAGIIEPEVTSKHWRTNAISDSQKGYIHGLAKKNADHLHAAPDNVTRTMREIYREIRAGQLNMGDASDYITILKAVSRCGGWPSEVMVPDE